MILEVTDTYEDPRTLEKVIEIGVLKTSYMLPRENQLVNRYSHTFKIILDPNDPNPKEASQILDDIIHAVNNKEKPQEIQHLDALLSEFNEHFIDLSCENIDTIINNVYEKFNR